MAQAHLLNDFGGSTDLAPPLTARGGITAVPHVVAWNLTQRCNLACSHCYISAGPWQPRDGEITLEEFKRIADEVLELSPGAMFVLTGGEPLVRKDLEDIARYSVQRGATAVVGTNGVGLTQERIASLQEAGVTGVAVSIDSLDAETHNQFRHGQAALEGTLAAIDRLREAGLDFIVQTTATRENQHELQSLVAFSAEKGAVSFNLYFLVETGRGEDLDPLSPAEHDALLAQLADLQKEYRGRMLIRSKCQPQIMRHIHEKDPDSPLLQYGTRCPCGVQYCRITPDAKLTPCPYLPAVAGDLRQQSFREIWEGSELLAALRQGELGGKCGDCEYQVVCGGCRARGFAQSGGDPLAADASCAYEPTGDLPLVTLGSGPHYGSAAEATLSWSPEAEARMKRIPSFVRSVVMGRVEDYARKKGCQEITPALLDEVRGGLPIDFSKKAPFFLRRDD